jgi:hypothetical protein
MWWVGMEVIAYNNDEKLHVINSHRFAITAITEKAVVMKRCGKDRSVTVPRLRMQDLFRWGWCEPVARLQGGTIEQPFNIYEVDKMSLNALNTAITRTRKWEHIGIDGEGLEEYVRFKYADKAKDIEYRDMKLEKGVIYEWTDKEKSFYYIGKTVQQLKQRDKQHKAAPVNKVMAEALAKPGAFSTPLVEVICTATQLDELETKYIHAAVRKHGPKLANIAKTKNVKDVVPVAEVKAVPIICSKFKIKPHERDRCFRIRWTPPGGKQETETFKWFGRSQDEAKKEAEAFRATLIAKYGI